MKILLNVTRSGWFGEGPYQMDIIDTDKIQDELIDIRVVDLDINKLEELEECVNIEVIEENFKDEFQNPKEYLIADFDIENLFNRKGRDFQITNVYYDEANKPQLYRSVRADGHIEMHDISELEYAKKYSILGETLEKLPDFVKKEPISHAYEWWKAKDEASKKYGGSFLSGHFEASDNMPVKLLYHYLIGVKGFKVGYHTVKEITDNYFPEVQHEYMLFKDTANIKLREDVPNLNDESEHEWYELDDEVILDEEEEIVMEITPYYDKGKIEYYGALMSMICKKENYPNFDINHGPSSKVAYDEDGIAIHFDYYESRSIYNRLEANDCISKDWRLGKDNSLFGITDYALIPSELAFLSASLQSEKERTIYANNILSTHGHWSMFNTDNWIKAASLAISTQFYSPELREKINPILQNYQTLFLSALGNMIEEMGAKDALEVMKWSKENIKKVLNDISFVREDGTLQKANVSVVDQMSNLFTYKRNNYPLPDWLQIYSPETIDALGGVESLQQVISTKGEEEIKESILSLAEGIESDKRYEFRRNRERFIKPEELIIGDTISEDPNYLNQSFKMK